MSQSRYEKYIVRKPGIIKGVSADRLIVEVPETDKIPRMNPVDTGPLVIFSSDFFKDAPAKVEYGFVTGDTVVGNGSIVGKGLGAHKHDYGELFLFLGTNPDDTHYLGAEVEFWLGEGEALEKVLFHSSSCVYVPPGTAHFPLVYRGVKSPIMMMVVVPSTSKHSATPVKRDQLATI